MPNQSDPSTVSNPAPLPVSRQSGGHSTHLSPEAEALVVERILTGDTNAEMNAALRKANHLKPGENISDRTFATYRKSDAVKVSQEKLTEEARQAGHAALSEAIVLAVRSLRTSATELLDADTGTFKGKDTMAHRTAAGVFFKSAEFLWNRLGVKDVLSAIEEGERQALDSINQSDIDQNVKEELALMVKENSLQQLRLLAEKKRELAAASVATAVVPAPVEVTS